MYRARVFCAVLAATWLSLAPTHRGLSAELTQRWYRGNTHTHTLNSDGRASPYAVARWYREHGYQFVVITDHEHLTDVDTLNAYHAVEGEFLVMRGQEVTQRLSDGRQAHVNAINSTRIVHPIGGPDGSIIARGVPMAQTYVRNIAEVRAAGGIAQVNHPNYRWSVQPADLHDVPDGTLLEIWNGIPSVNNLGGTDDAGRVSISTEALWDSLLTRGQIIWAVGSDDSHDFHQLDDIERAVPGQAWVMVRASSLSPESITAALSGGDFYASTGIVLDEYSASGTEISISLEQNADARYMTRFIGAGGRVLAEVPGSKPRYRFQGKAGYVRASIVDSTGKRGWTQPVFLRGREAR